ncbi:hypothetical protein BDN72DRAFT_895919 [Pluteus cervinus]|uniref:Uncharacterized protein n=1 Tax=Pluteus cervinus TaxID=181527 RepID=A0ACD3AYK2_9AGAR|nr:hypothetical protein BDN72DRAFT_895919 [Pluteus cervinus]
MPYTGIGRPDYQSLLSDSDLGSDEGTLSDVRTLPPAPTTTFKEQITRWSTIIIIICTLVDAIIIGYLLEHSYVDADLAVHDLEYKSAFIGFDKLYKNKSFSKTKYEPIQNNPRILTQVSFREPEKVFPIWPAMHPTYVGYAVGAERRLLVNRDTSTIAQFRVLDWGMENCTLTLSFDEPKVGVSNVHISNTIGKPITLDVWKLKAQKKIDFSRLSWTTKAPRDHYVGSMVAAFGSTYQLPSFACASGSYQTFEVTCSQPNCEVDTTTLEWENSNLYIMQSQTV